jgi:hypothetical protein
LPHPDASLHLTPNAPNPPHPSQRFGEFERFIYDFLSGGGAGAGGVGEGLRLKLQTPLFVADALAAAAGRQIAAEVASAEGEVAALSAVRAQLDRFTADMEKDGAAQRAAVRELVAAVVARADKFVDRTLQISNVGAAGSYIFGGAGGASGLPVAKGFDGEVVQGAADQMAGLVAEHAAWLASNCEAQGDYYTGYLAARRRPQRRRGGGSGGERQRAAGEGAGGGESGESGESGTPSPPPRTVSGGGEALAVAVGGAMGAAQAAAAAGGSASLQAIADFNLAAAKVLLEEEIREVRCRGWGPGRGRWGEGEGRRAQSACTRERGEESQAQREWKGSERECVWWG